MTPRTPKGRFQKGYSGNPSGRLGRIVALKPTDDVAEYTTPALIARQIVDALPGCCDSHGFTYLVVGNSYLKIGQTINFPDRFASLHTGCPFPLSVLALARGIEWEAYLHKMCVEHHTHGEWFLAEPVQLKLRQYLERAWRRGTCLGCSLDFNVSEVLNREDLIAARWR